jgi:hypothetical protein
MIFSKRIEVHKTFIKFFSNLFVKTSFKQFTHLFEKKKKKKIIIIRGNFTYPSLNIGYFCKYPSNVKNLLLRCIKFSFSHFTHSVQKMSILPLILKLHRFGFQNYNTRPTQNEVVLAIILLYIFLKKR